MPCIVFHSNMAICLAWQSSQQQVGVNLMKQAVSFLVWITPRPKQMDSTMLGQKDAWTGSLHLLPHRTLSQVTLIHGYMVVCAPYGAPKQPEDVYICTAIRSADLGRKCHPGPDETAPTRILHRQQLSCPPQPLSNPLHKIIITSS